MGDLRDPSDGLVDVERLLAEAAHRTAGLADVARDRGKTLVHRSGVALECLDGTAGE